MKNDSKTHPKHPKGIKRKAESSIIPQAADSSGFQMSRSNCTGVGTGAWDIETLRKDETKRYKFAHSNARSAKRKTPILLGVADLVKPTQLGPILTKRFRTMDDESSR